MSEQKFPPRLWAGLIPGEHPPMWYADTERETANQTTLYVSMDESLAALAQKDKMIGAALFILNSRAMSEDSCSLNNEQTPRVDSYTTGKDGIGWDSNGLDDDPSKDPWRKK